MISTIKAFLISAWMSFQLYQMPTGTNQQLEFLSNRYRTGEVNQTVYLNQYKKIVALSISEDASAIKRLSSTAEPLPSSPQTTSGQIYSALSTDMGINLEDALLKLTLKINPGIALSGLNPDVGAKTLFEHLLTNQDNLEDPIQFDSLLVLYVMNKAIVYAQSNRSGLTAWAQSNRIVDFFSARLSQRVSSILSESKTNPQVASARAKQLLDVYGPLSFLPLDDQRWLILSTYKLVNLVPAKQLNMSGLRLKLAIQEAYMHSDGGNVLNLDDLLDTGLVLADHLDQYKTFESVYLQWIDKLNVYLAHHLATNNDMNQATWVLDKRWAINNLVRKRLVSILQKDPTLIKEFNVTHPVLQVYINKAISQFQRASGKTSSGAPDRSFDDTLNEAAYRLSHTYGIEANKQEPWIPSLMYQSLVDRIEIARGYLETVDNHSQPDEFIKLTEQRSHYRRLRSLLEQALTLRFQHRPLAPNESLFSHLHGDRLLGVSNAISIRAFASQTGTRDGVLQFHHPDRLYIQAGIYFADGPTHLELGDVEFHPLAMIYSQGHPVTLSALSLDGAWIDTTGLDQTQDQPEPPKDGIRSTSDGKQRGQQPSQPLKADKGGAAGTLSVTSQNGITNSILVSFGGDAENGFTGAPSPNCTAESAYEKVVYTWTDPNDKKPKKCKLCDSIRLFWGWAPLCPTYQLEGQICGWERKVHNDPLDVYAGPGGLGGDAGDGAPTTIDSKSIISVFTNSISGTPGRRGEAGRCGPHNQQTDGARDGEAGRSFHLNVEVRNA